MEQSIFTAAKKALFDPAAAWELRLASENGPQKSRFGDCLVLCLSIYGKYCYVKCTESVYFRDIHVYAIKTLLIERFLTEFFKL